MHAHVHAHTLQGGLEDWAYATSWDVSAVGTCQPTENGGYPKELASPAAYSDSQLRAYMFLVEAWNMKAPREAEMGTVEVRTV
jgi:hypothetical protein